MKLSQQPSNAAFASNIPKYFIYTALKGFCFAPLTAIWVIYLQNQRGLSLAEAAIVDSTFYVAAALGEVPTGIVADSFGRKLSLTIGTSLMCLGMLGWTFAPTVPLIMLAYVLIAIGFTFLSGAEDALFYEWLQISGRSDDYTRLVGRVNATFMGALALGSAASGLLATIDLILPFLIANLLAVVMLGIVLTFREPRTHEKSTGHSRKSYGMILRQSLGLMRARPALRYPMFYLALVPLATFMLEIVFLQPQSIALGVPIAGIGVIVMVMQLVNMTGATLSDHVKTRFGEERVLYVAPTFIISSLLLLAALQTLPILLLIVVMGFVTAIIRPLLLGRIQKEVADDTRATILSMQSLMFICLGAIAQPSLGFIADHAGLPAAYIVLAGGLSLMVGTLFWASRSYFPQSPIEMPVPLDISVSL